MKIIETNFSFGNNRSVRSGNPQGIVLHHAAASSASVETVHGWHKQRGYAGIGYHFYVRKDGKVYRGRPENWIGAHTVGHNSKIGICAEGNFENDTMSAAQKNAISEVIAYLHGKYGTMKVYGHRNLDATACPGKNYPFDEIVNDAKNAGKTDAAKPTTTAKKNLVLDFQKATIADGVSCGASGADGIWGVNTAKAAQKLIKKGRKGNRVKLLQQLVGATADGIFGAKTLAAVKAYQSKKGLAVDGIVGLNTWKALLGV